MASVADRVRKVTGEVLGVDESEVTEEKDFAADLGAESIQGIELMAAFNAEFDIDMDEEGALGCRTVGEAIAFIEGYVSE